MAITSIPNKISEHNAWGFQLIKVREIKRMMPLQVGHLAGLTPNVQGQPACRNHTMSTCVTMALPRFLIFLVLQCPFKYPFKKGPYEVRPMSLR